MVSNISVRAYHADGEANTYTLMQDGNWLASIRLNGELTVEQQQKIMEEFVKLPDLLDTMREIAATPLYHEPLPADQIEEAREMGEWDDDDGFEPSLDTEQNQHRDNVEAARHVLGLPLSVDMPEKSEAANG